MPNQAGGGAKPKPDDAEQSRRFEEAAREVGADESGKLFSKALRRVVPRPRKRAPSKPAKR